jgi:hypothetical protein
MDFVGYAGAYACAMPTAQALVNKINTALAYLAVTEIIGSSSIFNEFLRGNWGWKTTSTY